MKKLLTVLFTVITLSVFAGLVSVDSAKLVAERFTKQTVSLSETRCDSDVAVFYVFNILSAKGFVIVSAEDRVIPILGYSYDNSWTKQGKLNEGLNNWITNTSAKITKARQYGVQADSRTKALWIGNFENSSRSGSIGPLLTTTWDQDPYYNAYCPLNSADNQNAVTGCVATSMAQIMKFWNYPSQGVGSYSYNDVTPYYSYNYGTQSANFGATSYQWPNMANSIGSSNYPAVATLMYHCGVSVGMDYGDLNQGGSGAYVGISDGPQSEQYALGKYFSYDSAKMSLIRQSSYTVANWITIIENELNNGRPVEYEGFDPSGAGHAWICDGYDGNNNLHMNWGWGGYANGYFAVGALNAGGYQFNQSDAALIGIQPLGIVSKTCGIVSNINSTATAFTGTISFTGVTGATSYNIEYKAPQDSKYTLINTTATSYTISNLIPGLTYIFGIQTKCTSASDTSYYVLSSFNTTSTCLPTTPQQPTFGKYIITSTNGVPTVYIPDTLHWTRLSNDASYHVFYKTQGGTGNAITTNNFYPLPVGAKPKEIDNFYVITSCKDMSTSVQSSTFTYTVPDTGVVIIPPVDSTCYNPFSIQHHFSRATPIADTITWNTNPMAKYYVYQYRLTLGKKYTGIKSVTKSEIILTGLFINTSYTMQLATYCVKGIVDTFLVFRTPNGSNALPDEMDTVVNVTTLKVYPNPGSTVINVHYITGAVVDIYTSSGRLALSTKMTSDLFVIDVSTLPSGVYIVAAKREEEITSTKILIQR